MRVPDVKRTSNSALVIAAHGSRRNASNEEIAVLARAMEDAAMGRWQTVRPAFLEFVGPGVVETVDALVAEAFEVITIFPYFHALGKHAAADIPELVRQLSARHPGVTIRQAPHLGALPGLAEFILHGLDEYMVNILPMIEGQGVEVSGSPTLREKPPKVNISTGS